MWFDCHYSERAQTADIGWLNVTYVYLSRHHKLNAVLMRLRADEYRTTMNNYNEINELYIANALPMYYVTR